MFKRKFLSIARLFQMLLVTLLEDERAWRHEMSCLLQGEEPGWGQGARDVPSELLVFLLDRIGMLSMSGS